MTYSRSSAETRVQPIAATLVVVAFPFATLRLMREGKRFFLFFPPRIEVDDIFQ